jgi:hypothetical protein
MFTQNYSPVFLDSNAANKYERAQMPTRVVMNNQTLIIFSSDTYSNQIMSFNLKDTEFKTEPVSSECFLLINGYGQTAELCAFPGVSNKKQVLDDWGEHYNLFKYKCKTPRELVTEDSAMPEEMKKKLEQKLIEAKKELLQESEALIKKKAEEEDEKIMQQKIQKTKELLVKAFEHELTEEEMVKKEQEEKDEKEEMELQKVIEEEKKKAVRYTFNFRLVFRKLLKAKK